MRDRCPDIDLGMFLQICCELPETYEYLDRIRAVLNIDITVIKPIRILLLAKIPMVSYLRRKIGGVSLSFAGPELILEMI